ncbi:WD40 repeat-like protein [Daldinia caldariorum]|uniref:WD40 repeat-like protein n=1 Tax=Daldinia caldariorum TaxID=326644 RepID=UPI002007DBBE|nr:WD40 repeat-like protein [Daldinia caldariorum]KAI1472973.1 WD40 repeat-like protein [Daldinia caldariorum]
MKATTQGDVSVYTISGANTARPLPDWLARRRKRSLKSDPEYQSRIELLQDFEFEEASQCVRVSEDNDWIMSTGTYKPQFHVHYLPHLSLSYSRHTKSLNTTFLLLSADYTKSLHLQSDRKLEFHTPAGCHYELRLPRYGRDLVYDRHATEALVPSVGLGSDGNGEVFRMNLEIGRFMKSYQIDVGSDEGVETGLQGSIGVGSVNTAAIAENSHNLLAFGTSIGSVEFWDSRSKSRVAILGGQEGEITALDFNPSGLSLATGTSNGLIKLFDLRSPKPLLQKDHGPGFPIKNLIHMTTSSQEKKVLSADKQMIKIWDELDGETWTSVEPLVDINFVTWCKNTGMILTANEGKPLHSFFIPQLGSAPRWCSFLDNMVEEMAEEVSTEQYDNFKFLTLPELKSLSLDHLIGKTNLLRPYMHGYFVASKLYEQARLIANPYAVEEERAKRIKEKIEKERASRIRGNKKVKVNQKFVDKLLKRQEKRANIDTNAGVLGDERFTRLFEDEEFKIDENSREFQVLNPSTKVDPETGAEIRPSGAQSSDENEDSSNSDESDDEMSIRKTTQKEMVMRVSSSNRENSSKDVSLGSRAQKSGRVNKIRNGDVVGERQVTFVPDSGKKKKSDEAPRAQVKDRRNEARRSASTNVFRRL